MTRINTIHPADLLDQHLFIEFREITRIATAHRHLNNRERVPHYVLGSGHMKFFYDKGAYCEHRLIALQNELKRRGTVNFTPKTYRQHIEGYHQDWLPTFEAHAANIMRLHEKLFIRPTFYTYCGKRVAHDFYLRMLDHYVDKPKQLLAYINSTVADWRYADHPEYGVLKARVADCNAELSKLIMSSYHEYTA